MISRILDKIKDKDKRDDIAFGLAVGLAVGLVFGLIFGLAVGLAAGLVFGLVFGLAVGLAVGLAAGLTNLFQLIPKEFIWIIGLIIGIIILSEVLFNGRGYKSGSKFWFTCKRKIEAILESLMIIINGLNIKYLFVEYKILDKIPYQTILKWIGYIGVGIIIIALVIGVFYLWIKLNEMRVRK